jgi:hypothetical protein
MMEICGPLGSEKGCSVCERCKAEILLAEADFRERRLRDENQRLRRWLGVIESHPSGIVPDRIAAESMREMARNALEEIAADKGEDLVQPAADRGGAHCDHPISEGD